MRASTALMSPAFEAASQMADASVALSYVAAICGDAFEGAYIDAAQSFIESTINVDVHDKDALVLATDRLHDADLFTSYTGRPGWSSGVATLQINDTRINIGVRATVAK